MLLQLLVVATSLAETPAASAGPMAQSSFSVNLTGQQQPFPHYWKRSFGR